jgi:hypothetical protein
MRQALSMAMYGFYVRLCLWTPGWAAERFAERKPGSRLITNPARAFSSIVLWECRCEFSIPFLILILLQTGRCCRHGLGSLSTPWGPGQPSVILKENDFAPASDWTVQSAWAWLYANDMSAWTAKCCFKRSFFDFTPASDWTVQSAWAWLYVCAMSARTAMCFLKDCVCIRPSASPATWA